MNKVATTDNSTPRTQVGEAPTRKTRPRKSDWMVSERPISIRFEPEMIERLDRIAIHLSKVNANIRIGRSSELGRESIRRSFGACGTGQHTAADRAPSAYPGPLAQSTR